MRLDGSFSEVFAPLLDQFSSLYWLLDLVAGPFSYSDRDWDEQQRIDRHLDSLCVEKPELEKVPAALYGPGVLPQFAHLLWEDEWGYYVALSGTEKAAVDSATSIPTITPPSDAASFRSLVLESEAYLIQVEYGHWHVFSRQSQWLDILRRYHPSSAALSSRVYSAP